MIFSINSSGSRYNPLVRFSSWADTHASTSLQLARSDSVVVSRPVSVSAAIIFPKCSASSLEQLADIYILYSVLLLLRDSSCVEKAEGSVSTWYIRRGAKYFHDSQPLST